MTQSVGSLGYVQGFLLPSEAGKDAAAATRERWPEVSSMASDDGIESEPTVASPSAESSAAVSSASQQLARSSVVRLLVEFIGAVQGSLYSVTSFVDDALSCYRWAASRFALPC